MPQKFETWLPKLVPEARFILDAGCGSKGGWWWRFKRPDARLVAVDLCSQPPSLLPGALFFQMDIVGFCRKDEFRGFFDLIVADHILEHVPDVGAVCEGFHRVLKEGGRIHVGIPDAMMFSERFYHLIHPEGGGHISKLTLQSLSDLMADRGLRRVDYRPWPEDWLWLKHLYDWKGRGIKYFSQEDLNYIADVFIKELTPEKGYYYGWEILFEK